MTAELPPPPPAAVAPAPEPAEAIHWPVPFIHSAGVMLGMRLSLSLLWPDAYAPLPADRTGRRWLDAYSGFPEFRRRRDLFESDGDPWYINVVGHGLFGSEVYGRVRQCGGNPLVSLAFAAGVSTVWEFGVESFNKRPSAVDLVATPLMGMLIGEARHGVQRWLRTKPRGFWRSFAQIVIDPLGEAERGWLNTRC